ATLVTSPVLVGKLPRTFGVALLEATTEPFCVIVEIGAVMVNGSPDILVKIPPSCQPSTNRWMNPGARLRNRRFAPKGNSQTPLACKACVRLNPKREWFKCRLLGSRYSTK